MTSIKHFIRNSMPAIFGMLMILSLSDCVSIKKINNKLSNKTMALKITDENVEELLESGKPVVIDFWATWCGPCVGMAPVIDELAEEYEGKAVIGKYNVDEEGEFASDNRVMSLPTILFFKNGKKTDIRLVGSQTKENLKAKIEELLAL